VYKDTNGAFLFASQKLNETWGNGFALIGDVTFESAAYVARYVTKKVTGEAAAEHYMRVDESTGELVSVRPEYVTMSRNPGIGATWFQKYGGDVYPSDSVIVKGWECSPPRFYDERLKVASPEAYERLKAERRATAAANVADESPERLRVRETVKLAQFSMLKRSFEDA